MHNETYQEKELSIMETGNNEKSLDAQKPGSGTDQLLMLAINKDLDVEKLKALIQMKNDEESRQAKKEFDFHFTEMQKEFEPIEKTKEGYDFAYAPLSEMEKKFLPIITKHGFSHRWRETTLEDGGKLVTIVVSGWGYTDDTTSTKVPFMKGTSRQNEAHKSNSLSSIGQRATFKMAFGIVEIGQEKDGELTYDQGIAYGADVQKIRECETVNALIAVFRDLWTKYKDDPQGQKTITIEKDLKKKELGNANNQM